MKPFILQFICQSVVQYIKYKTPSSQHVTKKAIHVTRNTIRLKDHRLAVHLISCSVNQIGLITNLPFTNTLSDTMRCFPLLWKSLALFRQHNIVGRRRRKVEHREGIVTLLPKIAEVDLGGKTEVFWLFRPCIFRRFGYVYRTKGSSEGAWFLTKNVDIDGQIMARGMILVASSQLWWGTS